MQGSPQLSLLPQEQHAWHKVGTGRTLAAAWLVRSPPPPAPRGRVEGPRRWGSIGVHACVQIQRRGPFFRAIWSFKNSEGFQTQRKSGNGSPEVSF